jgi:GDPmannose 4,6-dehydratase
MTDAVSLMRVLKEVTPDEIYHLAAQSHVRISFDIPVYTFETEAVGTLNLLESVRTLGLKCKIYNAASSEMFGSASAPQNEETLFQPRSPYAIAKVAAYHFCVNYREAYKMWIANGILFNHESPRRGGNFVTKKITEAVSRIKLGLQEKLILGNLYAARDWGYSPDYVEAMWLMLQEDIPDDFVISTGEVHTVKEFVNKAFEYVGINIVWQGSELSESGFDSDTGKTLVEVSSKYFRPTEADYLLGDSTKARTILSWQSKTTFNDLIKIMLDSDLNDLVKEMNNSNLYVNKPWGYEHTVFKDDQCLIWRLIIKKGESTSYHCHPNKITKMIVLNGTIKLNLDNNIIILNKFDSQVIEKGLYHSSEALSEECELIEIDSPPLVTDIIRLDDKYGREGKPY